MDFDFSVEEKAFSKRLGSALKELSADRDFESGDVRQNLDAALDALSDLAPYLGLGLEASTESGTAALIAATELVASMSPSLCLSVETSSRVLGRALAAFGNNQQKESWLDPITEGRHVGALALSETTMNIVNDPLTTCGERHGDTYLVSGHKGMVINATVADVIGVVGLIDEDPAIFPFKKDAPGLTIGDRLATSGFQGTAIAPVTLDECEVHADDVVVATEGRSLLADLRRWENLALISVSLGLMKTCLEVAKKHARTHKTGGRPIAKYQEVSFKLAEMLTLYQTSQLLAYRAGWTVDSSSTEADALVDCAKVFCAESSEEVASAALQILSAAGTITPNPVENAFRCSKFLQIAGTSSEIARVQIGDDSLSRWG